MIERWPRDPGFGLRALGHSPAWLRGMWFHRGREAIVHWGRSLSPKRRPVIAAPALVCKEVDDHMRAHFSVIYYKLNENLTPVLSSLMSAAQSASGVLLVDFFGADCTSAARVKLDVPFLLDRCQCLPVADFACGPSVYSLRKMLPDAFGGNAALLMEDATFVTRRRGATVFTLLSWLASSLPRSPQHLIYQDEEGAMPQRRIVENISWDRVADDVHHNAKRIVEAAGPLGKNVGFSTPTFALPLATNTPLALLEHMHRLGIHAYRWPAPPHGGVAAQTSIEFRNTHLCVPVPVNVQLGDPIISAFRDVCQEFANA